MIKKLASHLGEYKRSAIVTPLLSALEAIMDILLPTIMAFIIDQGIEKSDMNAIVKALVETGFTGYFRPDHGRMIWSEVGSNAKPGYGLYDRALGSAYLNGLIEANGGIIE